MELLGLGVWFLFIYVISNAAQDLMHAWRGTENPRLKLKLAQARQAGRTRYGIRDYLGDLWSDALQARTERRRQKARDAQWVAEGDGLEPVVVPAPDFPPAPVTAPPSRRVDGRPETDADRRFFDLRESGYRGPIDQDGYPQDDLTSADHPQPDIQPSTEPEPPAGDEFPRPWTPVLIRGGAGTEPADQTPTDQPTSTEENPIMSTAAAEVMGLDRSIAYTEDIAAAAANHNGVGGEEYMLHLQASNVSGAALASAAAMQQAAEALRAAAEAHAEDLKEMKTVQEAYDQVPDAGNQDYLQNGR